MSTFAILNGAMKRERVVRENVVMCLVGSAVVLLLLFGLSRPTYVTYATATATSAVVEATDLGTGRGDECSLARDWSSCLESNSSFYRLVVAQLNMEETVYFVQMSPFLPLITAASEKTGLAPFVIASHIKRESQFDPRAVSSRDAFGLMGLTIWAYKDVMRLRSEQTWVSEALEGYGPLYWEDVRFDPELNVLVGAIYYRFLLNHFEDTQLASLAYNWGMGNVQLMLDKYGTGKRVLRRLDELAAEFPAWVEPAEYPGHISRLQTVFRRVQEQIKLAYATYREIRVAGVITPEQASSTQPPYWPG